VRIFFDSEQKHVMITRMEPIWNEMGHFLSRSPRVCDVQLSMIRIEKVTRLPIVLRLDGVYYDLATDYTERNSRISDAHAIADGIIYQSGYGKGLCEYYLEKKKASAISRIIPNGIEKRNPKRRDHKGINIVVASIWRRHKRLKEIIDLFLQFAGKRRDVYLYIIGDLCENVKGNDPRIFYYGQVRYSKIKELYETADLHIHLSKRDNCPNTVLEAIGAGVPVLTTNLCGGATEICGMYNEGYFCYEGEDTFFPVYNYQEEWNELPEGTKTNLLESMEQILSSGSKFGAVPDRLNIRTVARKYIEFMEEICGKN